MSAIEVTGPDGAVHEFPAGTNPAVIKAALDRHYAAYNQGQRQGAGSGIVDTLNRALPGLSELGAGVETLGRAGDQLIGGQPVDLAADFKAARDRQQGSADALQARHPAASNLITGAGMALPLAAALATGGEAAPAVLARSAPQTFKAAAARTVANAGRGAVLGGSVNALYAGSRPGDVDSRVNNAVNAFLPGAILGGALPIASAIGGAGLSATRSAINAFRPETPLPASVTSLTPVEQKAAGKFAAVAKPDPAAMATRAAAFRGAGIAPTLVDSTDDSGQGVVRALASRRTPARGEVQAFAERRAANLPDRMSAQARDIVSSDPRTPEEIAQGVVDARTAQAEKDFTPVRADPVKVTPTMAQALQSKYGQAAIRRAADRAEADLDPARGAALNVLADHVASTGSLDGAKLTVGQAHDISRALFDKADAATDKGDRDALNTLGARIRDQAKIQSPGYEVALTNFANASGLADAPGIGRQGLTANSTFPAELQRVAAIPGGVDASGNAFAPQGLELARPGFRRAIEEASGNNPARAPAVARRIATAPEQQARNAMILGDADAARLQTNMGLEADAVRNAQNANPRAGSNTALNAGDQAAAANVTDGVGIAGNLAHGNLVGAAMGGFRAWMKSRGFSDAEAEALSRLAIDPAKHDDALSYIASKVGAQQAAGVVPTLRQVATDAAAGSAAGAAATPAATVLGNAFAPPPGQASN